ncbi:hypothetical protein [Corynebacterium renale]|uniref:Deoxyribose-phosphate aldolase n=1 Tax=Corynebacterium renale TaxID=1724 RepID=A0A2A9DN88_9CORY|nr:hypothetical protein [Corynebacterium renale]PFG27359.1 deoxyribose-phosphate aldolase [Corynebacterium renale]SQI23554.1 deoxyribose-phosphate aldolase deoc [Corynebacterium renale]
MVLTPTRVDIPAALAQARSTGEKVVLPAGWVQPTEGLYDGATVIAAVAYPTGTSHSLIKATEARFAVQCGASEILLALDASATEENALIADIMAVREAVSEQVPVWLHEGFAGQVPQHVQDLTGARVLHVAGVGGLL